MSSGVCDKKIKVQADGSITVTMTLILLIVTSMLLVLLENAYVFAGKTLALQTVNKGLESVMGRFYAPLYSQYGLFALPIGEGLSYEDYAELESVILDAVNGVFCYNAADDIDPFIWNVEATGCSINEKVFLTDNERTLFAEQIKEAAVYDMVLEISETVLSLKDTDIGDIKGILSGTQKELDSAGNITKGDGSGTDDESTEELKARNTYNTLTTFLQDGFSGWWFEDATTLSSTRLVPSELPSFNCLGDDRHTELFAEFEFADQEFVDGEYLDKLADDPITKRLQAAMEEAVEGTSSKVLITTYSAANMDNYLKDEVDGRLKYEQEYLIFGNDIDETNVKKAAWSIFGIRLIANLLYLLSDSSSLGELREWASEITLIAGWITVLVVIAAVVLAVENAIVETAAILKGKSVDFAVTKASQTVQLSEIFGFSKSMIMAKANAYQGVSAIRLPYQTYLYFFMLMVNENTLLCRMMDIIEINMQKMYNSNFSIDKCLIGFNVYVGCNIPFRFMNSDFYANPGSSSGNSYVLESAIIYSQ